MAGKSNIEWTGHTWNPFAGCAVLSPGCTNCYAMKMAARLDAMGQELYKGLTKPSKAGPVWRGTVRASPDALLAPLKRKKPTTYFVNSMSDLFYENFSDDLIDQVFAVMALSPQHTFQVLTKRAERMRDYFAGDRFREALPVMMWKLSDRRTDHLRALPLHNIWLGVSCEDQRRADERVPHLLATPAAVRFVSAEPLLGRISFRWAKWDDWKRVDGGERPTVDHLDGLRMLDWIIVGGESGHDARPFNIEWADEIVEQCREADVRCFVKQLGTVPLVAGYPMHLKSMKGGDWDEWPERLRVREMPQAAQKLEGC